MRLQAVLDARAEWHGTLVFLTILGVIAAQGDQLFADWTSTVRLALTALGMRDDTLHLGTARHTAVGIAALAGVQQRIDAALDGALARVLRTLLLLATLAVLVEAQTQLVHLVVVSVLVKARYTHVKVLQQSNSIRSNVYSTNFALAITFKLTFICV